MALLASWSGQQLESLPPVAYEVAQECGNLPLALAMIGASVRGHPDRWDNAKQRLVSADLDRIRQQFPNYPYPDLLRALEVSVDALAPAAQAHYEDFAIFVEGMPVPESVLGMLWAQDGLDRYEVQDIIDTLVDRSLVRRDERNRLTLHPLQKDYVRRKAGELRPLHDRLLAAYAARCPAGWPSGPNDGYFFQCLDDHLWQAERQGEAA